MKLTVVLGASEEVAFDIHLHDTAFVQKWVKELRWCLDNCSFNQSEAFLGLITLEESVTRLEHACKVINQYLPGFIEIREDMQHQPQEYFNYLHMRFENLSGGFGTPTRLFLAAPDELRAEIRNLNMYVHRTETQRSQSSELYISFNKDQYRRTPLLPEDYDSFEFDLPPGTLFLHYVELGKEFVDLYEDGLELDYTAATNLHYYSGEASLWLVKYNAFSDVNYLKWLQSRGIDPYNKALGHGKLPLGQVEDVEKVSALLDKHRYLNKILIKD